MRRLRKPPTKAQEANTKKIWQKITTRNKAPRENPWKYQHQLHYDEGPWLLHLLWYSSGIALHVYKRNQIWPQSLIYTLPKTMSSQNKVYSQVSLMSSAASSDLVLELVSWRGGGQSGQRNAFPASVPNSNSFTFCLVNGCQTHLWNTKCLNVPRSKYGNCRNYCTHPTSFQKGVSLFWTFFCVFGIWRHSALTYVWELKDSTDILV